MEWNENPKTNENTEESQGLGPSATPPDPAAEEPLKAEGQESATQEEPKAEQEAGTEKADAKAEEPASQAGGQEDPEATRAL